MNEKKQARAKGGFTLIEIIAVLVILGILAAVAVPKYIDMQDQARTKAINSALAALASSASLQYANYLMTGGAASTWTIASPAITVGEFNGSISDTTGTVTVTVTGGPTWTTDLDATDLSKSFEMYD